LQSVLRASAVGAAAWLAARLAARPASLAPGSSRQGQRPRQHTGCAESVENRSPKRLVKRTNVEQEGDDREDRKRHSELPRRLEGLPPQDKTRRRLHECSFILARDAGHRGGLLVRSLDGNRFWNTA